MWRPSCLIWIRCLTMLMFICRLPYAVNANQCNDVQIETCDCQEVFDLIELECSERELKSYPEIDNMHQVS